MELFSRDRRELRSLERKMEKGLIIHFFLTFFLEILVRKVHGQYLGIFGGKYKVVNLFVATVT